MYRYKDRFQGWKTIFDEVGGWVQYNSVDFINTPYKVLKVKTSSPTGGVLEVRIGGLEGTLVSKIVIPETETWTIINSPILKNVEVVHNILVSLTKGANAEVDWINFE